MAKTITWLHLSDRHFNFSTGWDSCQLDQSLIADLKCMRDRYGIIPDLVFFTGDIAFGATSTDPPDTMTRQFDAADHLFQAIRECYSPEIPKANFFLVPGNHDVERARVSPDQTAWLDREATEQKITSMLGGAPSIHYQRLLERLGLYRAYLRSKDYKHLGPESSLLTYASTVEVNGLSVGILGLNTAWSCCREEEKGKLWTGLRYQIDALGQTLPKCDIRVAAMHHPPGWFVEAEDPDVDRQLKVASHFALHGHEHKSWVDETPDHVRIAAGACYDRSNRPNGYNFVKLDLASGCGEVWLRRYDAEGRGWVPHIIYNRTDNEGRLVLQHFPVAAFRTATGSGQGSSTTSDEPQRIAKPTKPYLRYDSDNPPITDVWVGRDSEMADLIKHTSGVCAVTGIGGQGKSSLVAKFLTEWRRLHPDGFWDWRDCREEGDRFHTQLVSIIEHLTEGQVTGSELQGEPTRNVVRYLLDLCTDREALIILDNVDHYTDVNERVFTLGIETLVQGALRAGSKVFLLLTCRPSVSYPSSRYIEISLPGLTYEDAELLLKERNVDLRVHGTNVVREIWTLTEGHPLWLNLIAVQISRNPAAAPELLGELRKGKIDSRAHAMLQTVWNTLNSRQKTVLRSMAEMVYAASPDIIHGLVGREIKTHNQFDRAFRGLKALGLLVERQSDASGPRFDLHPLVRSFIRLEYAAFKDRKPIIEEVLSFFRGLTGRGKKVAEFISRDLLEQYPFRPNWRQLWGKEMPRLGRPP